MAIQTLYALFPTVLDAERAIGALTDHGIRSENIRVIARTPAEQVESERVRALYTRATNETSDRMGEPVASYTGDDTAPPAAVIGSTITPADSSDTAENVETVGKQGITTTTPQDAAAGAAIGTGVGMVAGMVATALAVTGVGLVGGILAAAIAATVATTAAGAVVGGVAGFLHDMGMPHSAAEKIADRINEGDYLISVNIDSADYDDIERILNKYNAVGVDDAVTYLNRPVQAALNPDAPVAPPANPSPAAPVEPGLSVPVSAFARPELTAPVTPPPSLLPAPPQTAYLDSSLAVPVTTTVDSERDLESDLEETSPLTRPNAI